MTGRSLQNLSNALALGGCPSQIQKFLVLFRLGKVPIEINGSVVPELCDFSEELPGTFAEDDKTDRPTIEIDPTTYFPTFIEEKEVRLTRTVAEKHQGFFNRYKNSNAIRIHADSYVGGHKFRHHGISIDVLGMLKVESFVERLKSELVNIELAPKFIIVPPHNAGIALASVVAEFFAQRVGNRPEVVPHLDLSPPGASEMIAEEKVQIESVQDQLRMFSPDDAIMVLDDVVTTGSRLLGYQKRLRDIEYRGQIRYLVGVRRMPSTQNWTDLCSTLRPNKFGSAHSIQFVEQVLLPNWDHIKCPWCIESNLLAELIMEKSGVFSAWTLERARLLRNAGRDGLVDDVFFGPADLPPLKLGINSLFVEKGASQAVVLTAVAAALQEMRTDEDVHKRLNAGAFPLRTVLSIKDLDRYTDGILRASLLRSATPVEYQRSARQKERSAISWVESIFLKDDDDSRKIQAEIALAMALRKLPIEADSSNLRKRFTDLGLNDLLGILDVART